MLEQNGHVPKFGLGSNPPDDGRKLIPLKHVKNMPVFENMRPTYLAVRRWGKYGVRVNGKTIKLMVKRIGGRLFTTIGAVHSFMEETNR